MTRESLAELKRDLRGFPGIPFFVKQGNKWYHIVSHHGGIPFALSVRSLNHAKGLSALLNAAPELIAAYERILDSKEPGQCQNRKP